MTQIIFATGNKDKMREIREIMAGTDVEIRSMKEAGIVVDITEDGTTFEENAAIKAGTVAAHPAAAGAIVLADDSGLEIDYLNKEPGIYSARYMGEDTPYDIKNRALLERLEGVPKEKRTARFVCAIAAVIPNGDLQEKCSEEQIVAGNPESKQHETKMLEIEQSMTQQPRQLIVRQTMEGTIGYEPEGVNGFGYDPIFVPDGYECSSAVISPEEKNAISHRGKALRAMRELLMERGNVNVQR